MALAALIPARREAEGAAEGLCATLPFAGRTLLEHQVRLAIAAGAGHVVVLVERLPATLVAAVDRLRRDGVRVELSRALTDAVDRFHPEEGLLVFADGWIGAPETVAALAAAPAPAILALPDTPEYAAFERIDATARWAGLLLVDGARLARTAATLGEWDLESTLLRRAVQEGAPRVDGAGDPGLRIVEALAGLAGLDRTLLDAPRPRPRDWPARWLFPLFERLAAPTLIRRGADPLAIGAAGVGSAAAGALAAWVGPLWLALALLLLSGPIATTAERVAAARLSTLRQARRLGRLRLAAAGVALAALANAVSDLDGWCISVLAVATAAGLALTEGERANLARLGARPAWWTASLDGLFWALLPFAAAGQWSLGVGALALYGGVSVAAAQRGVGRLIDSGRN